MTIREIKSLKGRLHPQLRSYPTEAFAVVRVASNPGRVWTVTQKRCRSCRCAASYTRDPRRAQSALDRNFHICVLVLQALFYYRHRPSIAILFGCYVASTRKRGRAVERCQRKRNLSGADMHAHIGRIFATGERFFCGVHTKKLGHCSPLLLSAGFRSDLWLSSSRTESSGAMRKNSHENTEKSQKSKQHRRDVSRQKRNVFPRLEFPKCGQRQRRYHMAVPQIPLRNREIIFHIVQR